MRNSVESLVILFRELKIAETCRIPREFLLINLLGEKSPFTANFLKYFGEIHLPFKTPFKISATQPSQVSALKKIINALYNVEKAIRKIELINLNEERSTASITLALAKKSYGAVQGLYDILRLINESSVEMQALISPHFSQILPKLPLLSEKLKTLQPVRTEKTAEERMGEILAITLKELPAEKSAENEGAAKLSKLIFNLPSLFKELKKLLGTGLSKSTEKPLPDPEEYQKFLAKNAKKMQEHFETLVKNEGLSLFPSYLGVAKQLLIHSSELLTTAAPLTKKAYKSALIQLQGIRQELLPAIIGEIESIEESLFLKPGVLTASVIEEMNEFYKQLAAQVNCIAHAAGVIDQAGAYLDTWYGKAIRRIFGGDTPKLSLGKPLHSPTGLDILYDEDFVAQLRQSQIRRLKQVERGDKNSLDAKIRCQRIQETINHSEEVIARMQGGKTFLRSSVEPFTLPAFTNLESAQDCYQKKLENAIQLHNLEIAKTHCNNFFAYLEKFSSEQEINQLEEADKEELRRLYKRFQAVAFAVEMDKEKRMLTEQTTMDSGDWIHNFKENKKLVAALTNEPDKKNNRRNTKQSSLTVKSVQKQGQSIKTFLSATLKTTQDRLAFYTQKQTEWPLEISKPKTVLQQLTDLKLSATIDNFIETQLQAFLKENLAHSVFSQLPFDKNQWPILELHKDSEEVALYKKLLNSLYYLKVILVQLENLGDGVTDNKSWGLFGINKARNCLRLFNATYKVTTLLFAFRNAKFYLGEIAKIPPIRMIANKGLALLTPLQSLPIVGNHLSNIQPTLPKRIETPEIDLIAAWKEQQEILKEHRASGHLEIKGNNPPIEKTIIKPEESVEEKSYLEQVSFLLYQISAKMHKINLKSSEVKTQDSQQAIASQAKLFAEELQQLKGISFGPQSLKKILLACNKINQLLTGIGKESRESIMSHLQEIPNLMAEELLAPLQELEFDFGLKPGILCSPINQKFNNFYQTFVKGLASEFNEEQQGVRLLIDTTKAEKLLLNEKKRLEKLNNSSEPAELKAYLSEYYKKIEYLYFKMDDLRWPGKLTQHDLKYLQYHTLDYLLSQTSAQYESTATPFQEASPAKIEEMMKKLFLYYYQQLQPYLHQIDPLQYDTHYFLRNLEKIDNFRDAAVGILQLEKNLEELVEAKQKNQQQQIYLCEERINYFAEQLQQEKAHGDRVLQTFKNELSFNYSKTYITEKSAELGQHSEIYFKKIGPDLQTQLKAEFEHLSVKNNIEEFIKPNISRLAKPIIEKYNPLQNIRAFLTKLPAVTQHIESLQKIGSPNLAQEQQQQFLQNYQNFLRETENQLNTDTPLTEENILNLRQDEEKNKEYEKEIAAYSKIIKVYEILDEMKHCLYKKSSPEKERIDKIKELMKILLDRNQNNAVPLKAAERLEKVRQHALSEECRKILWDNSDSFYIRLLKKLWQILTGRPKINSIFSRIKKVLEPNEDESIPANNRHF